MSSPERRCLVTGGAGFIGGHLVERLVARGDQVVVLDDLSFGDRSLVEALPACRLVVGDVADPGAWLGEVGRVDVVFHLAALISGHDSLLEPERYLDVNVVGLTRLLLSWSALGAERLVFASSSGVYGNSPEVTKREEHLPQPETVYALSKLAGEQLLAMYRARAGYDDVSLRFFNVYGPRQSTRHPYANVTCKFAEAAARGLPVKLYGDGRQSRDFIAVEDVVEALLLVAERPTRHRVYNVGTGQDASIAALLALAERLGGRALEVERLPPWPNDIRAIRADASRLRDELGWEPRVGLEEGLRRTIAWFRGEPP